jgi:hypothetical protein
MLCEKVTAYATMASCRGKFKYYKAGRMGKLSETELKKLIKGGEMNTVELMDALGSE